MAGLRREELAQLAGVSVSYYARLEQGQSRGASAEVRDAIARALLLDHHEREHLDRLADAGRHARGPRRPRPESLTDETRDLLRAVDGVPAMVQRHDLRRSEAPQSRRCHLAAKQRTHKRPTPSGEARIRRRATLLLTMKRPRSFTFPSHHLTSQG
ncbi:helix-turn-helix domain-containing protein [Streptomyces sp. NBC_00859]|nr:helix-turn-helix domain-containing protein [Streptomyces sp. NBC_00859]